jgi:hypothetical protein
MRLSQIAAPSIFVLASLALTGCTGSFGSAGFPDTPAQVAPGALRGSNFGGHAPIVGAHLFVLEAESSANGYGGKATSLLTGGVAGEVQDITGSAATNPTYGWYYIPTDSAGAFNITNDYTCSVGRPVYLYSQGGSPSIPSTTTAPVTKIIVANDSNGTTTTITLTSGTQNFIAGEPLTLSGFGGEPPVSSTVLSTGLSPTQFEISVPTSDGYPAGTYTDFGNALATGISGNNAQIVNLAMLGLCPGKAGEFANTLSYVYMNEVSTTAMAYAMAPFATSATSGITQDATHIGAPATAQGLLGLQNAAVNANQLYDIQGGNINTGGNAGGSDDHVARLLTPAGNGNVPQATLNTLGNILAACVDSTNSYNPYPLATVGTNSTQCAQLFSNATSTGGATGGTVPLDTATAMFNIAHLPAGASGNTSSFMANIYSLQGSSYPFTPQLAAQPNDFTVAIQYSVALNPAVSQAESIGIDSYGNIWMNSYGNKNIFEMSPLGVVTYKSPTAGYSYGYVSVDPSGNIWSGGNFATTQETKFTVTGTGSSQAVTSATFPGPYPTGFYDNYITVTDSSGNVYIGATRPTGGTYEKQWEIFELNNSGGDSGLSVLGLGLIYTGVLNATPVAAKDEIAHGAMENANTGGDIWFTTENYDSGPGWAIGRYNTTTGNVEAGFPITTGIDAPEMPGLDSNSNLWVANQNYGTTGGSLIEVSTAGTVTTTTGGTLSNPFGVAVDGLGNVWVTDRANDGGTSSILEYNGATAAAISPSANYRLGGQISEPLNIAIDPAGVIWLTSYDNSQVVEVFGQAAPVVTPLSYASGKSQLGTRP